MLENKDEPLLQKQNELSEYGFSDWNADGDHAGTAMEGYGLDEPIAADAISWLRTKGDKINSEGKSFFLSVNFVNPHDIMYYNPSLKPGESGVPSSFTSAGKPRNELYDKTYNEPIPVSWNEKIDAKGRVPAHSEYLKQWSQKMSVSISTEAQWRDFQNYYFNCIQDSDNSLMTVLNELKRLDMFDNTIIIFTSDHGDLQGSHGLWGKGGLMYENYVHVPMIIYHPEYEGGKKITAVTSHLDVAPTLVDMTNISADKKKEITKGLSGGSMLELIKGTKKSIRNGALFAFEMPSFNGSGFSLVLDKNGKPGDLNLDENKRGAVRGIVTEKYKFARYFSPVNFNSPITFEQLTANNDIELFDLESDPNELTNLAADPQKNKELIMKQNNELNELIKKEIGVDDGKEIKEVHKKVQAMKSAMNNNGK